MLQEQDTVGAVGVYGCRERTHEVCVHSSMCQWVSVGIVAGMQKRGRGLAPRPKIEMAA